MADNYSQDGFSDGGDDVPVKINARDERDSQAPKNRTQVKNGAAAQAQNDAPDIQEKHPVIASWQSILAANDTNKKIIFKFMKKGFTSLSAEELACTMVSSDFSLDFKKNTKEDWMVRYQFKVVERLQKCNFNFKWNTKSSVATQGMGEVGSFFELCKTGDVGRVVQYLRQWKGNEDYILSEVDQTSKKSGLHYAVEECHPQLTEYLLNKGAKADARDKMLKTPLHIACLKGYSMIVRLLVENKADPYERDFQGRHSLHFACCSASENSAQEIFTILSGDSTDLVHMPDHAGRTPLHYAIFNAFPGQIRMIQSLLMYGANINCLDENRRTPLHFAAMEGRSNIIPLLVQNGAAAGLKDYQQQTPMDLASNDNIRQMIIVYSPFNKFKPSDKDMAALEVEGIPKPIKKVANLPPSYYENFEHAQPAKKKKNFVKINQKAVAEPVPEEEGKAQFVCSHQCQPATVVPHEELCMNCRPLGPSNEWMTQKKSALPYNIRNYQASLLEYLKRVQVFGVESFQHVKKPYLFTGSWMEYVRNLDDLMLQINTIRPNEAVMKVFNILFPYDKPLPRGKGDELGLAGFYSDKRGDIDPNSDLADCHPDKLRDNLMNDREDATGEALRKNGVEDINDLMHMQQQMTQLQTANEMALVTIEEKDQRIMRLMKENEELTAAQKIKGTAEVTIIALEERIFALENLNKQLDQDKQNLTDKVRSLVQELEGAAASKSNAEADARLQEQLLQFKKKIEELEQQMLHERQKNMQLRLKSGQAFMAALNDPNYQPSGGKIVEEVYDPMDDEALMRLLQKIEEKGVATLEQKLEEYGDISKYINKTQFDGMLKMHDTLQTDYIRMNRIAGFAHMTGDVKKKKVSEVMFRINNRGKMREHIEDKTLKHIALYMDKQDWSIDKLFTHFNTDDSDNYLTETELFEMMNIIKVNVNSQLKKILFAMFDSDQNGNISKQELRAKLEPYVHRKAEVAVIADTDIKDKEELVEMYNEMHRKKEVFEDHAFDPSDKEVREQREAETIAHIKNGTLPQEPLIKGQIDVKLEIIDNIQQVRVEGKPCIMYKLKRTHFVKEGEEVKVAPKGKQKASFMKKFNWETGTMDGRIQLYDFFNDNMHMQGDTFRLQIFVADAATTEGANNATFIGEFRLKWKTCLDEDNIDNWQKNQQYALTDEDNQRTIGGVLSANIILQVRYLQVGHPNSVFLESGELKPKEKKIPKHLQKEEVKYDLTREVKGAAGELHCSPMDCNLLPTCGKTFEEGQQYGVIYSMIKDLNRKTDPVAGDMVDAQSYGWFDSRMLAVQDTNADTAVKVTVIKMSPPGQDDVPEEPIAYAIVPVEKLTQIYKDIDVKQKSFNIELKTMGDEPAGSLKNKIMLKAPKSQEEKKDSEMVAAGSLAAAANQ